MAKPPTPAPFKPDPVPPPAAPRTTFDRAFALDVLIDAGFPATDAEQLLSPALRLEPGTIQALDSGPLELSREDIAIRFAAGRAASSPHRAPLDDHTLNSIATESLRFADRFLHIRQLKGPL